MADGGLVNHTPILKKKSIEIIQMYMTDAKRVCIKRGKQTKNPAGRTTCVVTQTGKENTLLLAVTADFRHKTKMK